METPPKKQATLANKDIAAKKEVMDILFDDFHQRRGRVYRTNFFRGIFFGLGTALGGTIVIAIVIALLSRLVDIPGGFGDFIHWIVDTIQNK